MQRIGPLIKSVRMGLDYTQADIATRAGVSLPTLIGCEKGAGSITSLMLIIHASGHQLVWAGYDKEVGYHGSLAARRNARGLSQRRLAKAIGVSQTMIISLEKNFKGRIENLERVLHQLKLVPRLMKVNGTPDVVDIHHQLPDEIADLLDRSDSLEDNPLPAFIVGDATDILKLFPSSIIDMVMTSPPYYGLREYEAAGIGQEESLDQYVTNLMKVTKELHRVLKPAGSFWLNIGDSYINKHQQGVPWRVALKLIDEQGWILRNSNIWHKKKAGMDNSSDRLPNRHEMVFHFVKQTDYYYDADAIRKTPKQPKMQDGELVTATGISYQTYHDKITESDHLTDSEKIKALYELNATFDEIRNGDLNDFRMILRGSHRATHSEQSSRGKALQDNGFYFLKYDPRGSLPSDVWDIAPESTRGRDTHYAAYPEELCRIPILSTCTEGGIILDPFLGTGTTTLAAMNLNRRAIGIDLSETYVGLAKARCE
ncbi:MAG: DNA methyltransferase [Lentilitoribacter sp.]